MNVRQPAGAGGPTAARGLVVIAAAVVLGAVLLARGGHGSLIDRSSSTASKTSTTLTANVPTIPDETTTSTPPPTNAPASVKVAIFNGTGGKLPNAAGDNMRILQPKGYTSVSIADTTATDTSEIYYVTGAGGDAAAIADLLGLPVTNPKPTSDAASLPGGATGAQVIVIIGSDAAGSTTTN